MPRGVFITFEGGEGTGKSTQIRRLAAWLESHGREAVVTREPGGTPVAEAARSILLDPGQAPDGLTELFLLEAARHDHTERLIRPALARGAVVLCDRYADSSTVYQGLVRGLGREVVEGLNALATGGLEPDRTILLDLEAVAGVARARARNAGGDGRECRLDDEPAQFHRRVRLGFRELAADHAERFRLVDGSGDEEAVFARVLAALAGMLP